MKVSTRLFALVGAALLALATLGGISLYTLHKSLLADRQEQITNMLMMGRQLVAHYQGEQQQGKLTEEQAQAAAKEALTQLNNDNKVYFWVRLPNGLNLVHPNPKNIGVIAQGETMDGRPDAVAYREQLAKGPVALVFMKTKHPKTGQMAAKLNGVVEFTPWNWWIGTGFFNDDIDQQFWYEATRSSLFFLVVVAVLSLLGWRIVAGINRTLGGDPEHAADVTRRIAGKDLSMAISADAVAEGSLLEAIGRMQNELANTVRRIRNHAATIATASSEIAAGNQDLSARTEAQASSLEETAAAMEELTGTVRQNAEHARIANDLAQKAADTARHGGTVMDDAVRSMGAIEASSKRIADIIGVIDGIAFQTNILALNAAVEAARAGEQGRGFAVVAGEVRNLAQRSAAAAHEIKSLIGASVAEVGNGSRLVGDAGAAMRKTVDSIGQVSTIISEISVASNEQSQGIDQVNEAVLGMDEATQQNAALVEEAAASAASLQELARQLAELVAVFRLEEPAPRSQGALGRRERLKLPA
ncbi:methyl-accepting chemotaxis protein [Massilia terrae]|uniref:Methyl-accepting chemotaxis protein n=1 Tax=Massilia terrae TaxID=1811224 RepID=A0ABT2CU35_9BURK|nr:methyl-accepting chemotaxis protein [Massilia terrae]MCS0657493.1 methyl-accepting chemotaxis protein [Massilia terrae]